MSQNKGPWKHWSSHWQYPSNRELLRSGQVESIPTAEATFYASLSPSEAPPYRCCKCWRGSWVLAGVLDRAWFLPEIRDMVVAENAHSNYSFVLSQQCSLGNIHLDEWKSFVSEWLLFRVLLPELKNVKELFWTATLDCYNKSMVGQNMHWSGFPLWCIWCNKP